MEESLKDPIGIDFGPAERILWTGRPPQGFRIRAADAFIIPFSIMWGGFALFWEYTVLMKGGPTFMALWGIPFVLVGLYMIIGRFPVDVCQRANTYYAVTSERVVIATAFIIRRVKSLSIDTLTDVTLTEGAGGSGTITFGPLYPYYRGYSSSGWPMYGLSVVPCFELSNEARQVYEIIRETQKSAKRGA